MYYSDKPIGSKRDDQLGRDGFAALLAQSLLNLNTQDTFTVGLFGKWGSGKTSIVNMMLSEIDEQQKDFPESEKLIVVHFEPWNFSGTDQLLSQFFIRMSSEFQSKGDERLAKIGEALETYSEAFDILSAVPLAGGLLSFLGKKGAEAAGSKLKKGSDERDISKQKEFVIKLLQEQSNRILVVIDDIDRLSNEQIRQVFQLVTSVAKFPNTIYLLVFDKDIVVKALEKVQEGSGRDYLEKIIQMPIQIPDIKTAKLRQVLIDRLNTILSKHEGIGLQQIRWQKLYEPCIAPFIDSLRTINRLCNAVQFKLASISTEIDFADIVAISALEIQHPEVYEWVKKHKAPLTGKFDLSTIREVHKTQKEVKDFYTAQIKAILQKDGRSTVTDEQVEEIIVFLSHLFPHFGQKIGEIYEVYNLNVFRKNNQIAHPEKFDRYFSLDLDEVSIRRSEILRAAFETDCEALIKALLEKEEKGDSYEFLEEIRALSSDLSADRAEIIVTALLTVSPRLNTLSQKNFLSLPASALAEHMVIDLLDIIDPVDRFQFISNIVTNAELPVLQSIASIINMLELAYGRLTANGEERNYAKVITLEELENIEVVFVEKLKRVLTEHSLFDFGEWRLVCHLMECFAPDFMRTHMKNELKNNSCIVKYLIDSVTVWTGSGKKYEVNDSYKKYLTEECVLQAIESLKQSGELFTMSEDIQRRCCAFYIYSVGGEKNHRGYISENTVNELLSKWTP